MKKIKKVYNEFKKENEEEVEMFITTGINLIIKFLEKLIKKGE